MALIFYLWANVPWWISTSSYSFSHTFKHALLDMETQQTDDSTSLKQLNTELLNTRLSLTPQFQPNNMEFEGCIKHEMDIKWELHNQHDTTSVKMRSRIRFLFLDLPKEVGGRPHLGFLSWFMSDPTSLLAFLSAISIFGHHVTGLLYSPQYRYGLSIWRKQDKIWRAKEQNCEQEKSNRV